MVQAIHPQAMVSSRREMTPAHQVSGVARYNKMLANQRIAAPWGRVWERQMATPNNKRPIEKSPGLSWTLAIFERKG
jgi:hypothetical protein